MKTATFKKGIHPPHNKQSCDSALVECPAPSVVYIPLSQHIGRAATLCVSVGDAVKAGTLIGKAEGLGANIFSSISGVVKGVEHRKTPTGACDHVVIENDGKYESVSLPKLSDRSKESVINRIKEAGLVGMGGAGFPSHVKYSPKKQVDTFIMNAAECEPYITCDYRLLVERTKEVLKGAALLAGALGLNSYYVGIEDNKRKAVEAIENTACELGLDVKVVVLKSKYPQGAEKQLIYAITKRKVPSGGLPADVGVVVGNVHTAYAAYDAVENGTPLYRRALTVCGGGIKEQKNIWARTGTLYSDCEKFCGGATEDCVKTISGGPMMGFALNDTEYSVSKTTGAILFLSSKEANMLSPGPCINCAKCRSVCPMNLMPMYIDTYAQNGDYGSAKKYGALNCIECGCCAYTCPAKRPIVQSVRLAKRMIKERGL